MFGWNLNSLIRSTAAGFALVLSVSLCHPEAAPKAQEGLIRLVAPLDEPEYYCLDVPGFRTNVRLDAALMAHTCKPGADDEIFVFNYPGPGQIHIKAYELCVEAGEARAGSELFLKACSDAPLQRFVQGEEGRIRLARSTGEDLCLAVAPGRGQRAGGPSHVRRDLALQGCADTQEELTQWTISSSVPW